MYSLTVRFILPDNTDWSKIPHLMIDRAETLYRNLPGLVSKAFLYDPETREYGGNYVWETRGDGEAFLSSDIFKAATEKFGAPRILQIHPVAVYLDRGRLHVPVPKAIESIAE